MKRLPDYLNFPQRWPLALALGLGAIFLLLLIARGVLSAGLPEVQSLRELKLSVPLKIMTADGRLMGEYGAERRTLLKYADIPPRLVQAFLAAEDDRFFEHGGVDYPGLLRAVFKLVSTGDKAQGGSTITMQLARNVFLTSEKTFSRKFREILLAQKIERELNKEEILELYLNKIYLGERAYGVGAAALVYFGKPVAELSLSEMAVLAALPKAPSRDNPAVNPQRAQDRRNYVLRRMRDLGMIEAAEYDATVAQQVVPRPFRAHVEVDAYYVAEMVRTQLYQQYGEELYARGYTVITTIDSQRQQAANRALRKALQDYDERHGWRPPEASLTPAELGDEKALRAALDLRPQLQDLVPAVVTRFTPAEIQLTTAGGGVTLAADQFKWAGLTVKKILQPGDVVRLRRVSSKSGESWKLAQIPEVQGAFVALDPSDGAVPALAGGYDYFLNKFNHVTQARRQAGSGFKPFLYSAGLAAGLTPASVFLDAPVVFEGAGLESGWRPENYDNDFNGPTRLREALVQSRNLVSVRLLQAIGIDAAREYVTRFGMDRDRLPRDLTMALGSAVFTPMELARCYATIANGGFLIEPYFVREIRDGSGQIVFSALPKRACPACEQPLSGEEAVAALPPEAQRAVRSIEAQTAWLITSMMHDVTVRGTAAAVGQLGRNDLAGKTGTTNDETDAWFSGFQKNLVGVSWVGFDQPQPLGRGEVGGKAALPVWMDFMKTALKGIRQETWPRPPGLVDVRINPKTGKLAAPGDPSAIFETVPQEHIPDADDGRSPAENQTGVEDIF